MSLPERKKLFVPTRFGKIHVEDQLPPLEEATLTIFGLHYVGKTANWRVWERVMEPLAMRGIRVISIDLPGYGESEGNAAEGIDQCPAIVNAVISHLKLEKVILIGRAEGGRLALQCAAAQVNHFGPIRGVVASHPVAPTKEDLSEVKVPVLLTWAIDDRWGQPYFGPHGAAYFVKNLGCDIFSWEESDYEDAHDFYDNDYCDQVTDFIELHRRGIFKTRRRPRSPQSAHLRLMSSRSMSPQKRMVTSRSPSPQKQTDTSKEKSQSPSRPFPKGRARSHSPRKINLSQEANDELPSLTKLGLSEGTVDDASIIINKNVGEALIAPTSTSTLPLCTVELETNHTEIEKSNKSRVKSRFNYTNFLDDLTTLKVDTKYGCLAVYSIGNPDLTPLLMVHGDGKDSTGSQWSPAMVSISKQKKFYILAPDMPGYGLSQGHRSSFRTNGTDVIREILAALTINCPIVLCGRSVGGRTSIEYANLYPEKLIALILTHPVVPQKAVVQSLKGMPFLLTWASDDGYHANKKHSKTPQQIRSTAGHPYFGPHGAAYIVNLTGCELLSWKEIEYSDPYEFYATTYATRLISFLERKQRQKQARRGKQAILQEGLGKQEIGAVS